MLWPTSLVAGDLNGFTSTQYDRGDEFFLRSAMKAQPAKRACWGDFL
jgi:hypothetical protein